MFCFTNKKRRLRSQRSSWLLKYMYSTRTFKIMYFHIKIQDFDVKIPDLDVKILDFYVKIMDFDVKILDFDVRILDVDVKIIDFDVKIQDFQSYRLEPFPFRVSLVHRDKQEPPIYIYV